MIPETRLNLWVYLSFRPRFVGSLYPVLNVIKSYARLSGLLLYIKWISVVSRFISSASSLQVMVPISYRAILKVMRSLVEFRENQAELLFHRSL